MKVCKASVLISGKGSNLQALISARQSGRLNIELVHVISSNAQAQGLDRARKAGIPTSILVRKDFTDRDSYDHALANLLQTKKPDLIILAGFMCILGHAVLGNFRTKMINLHPSLLPNYRGTDTYARALNAGESEHGASMHFVTEELDGGPVISQVRIPIEHGDTPNSLMARLAPREHHLVVATTELFCANSVECRDNAIFINGEILIEPLQLREDNQFAF